MSWLAAFPYIHAFPVFLMENQWHCVDFVPLTVAGQRRSLTGFLPLMDVNSKG